MNKGKGDPPSENARQLTSLSLSPCVCYGFCCKRTDDLRFAFRYLFYQYRVDMTWVGHHHSYQRTCAVDLAKGCDDKSGLGLVNLVVGNAGAVLTANLEPEMPSWFQVAKLVHGYTKFEVTRKRISLKSIDVDGNVIDEWSKSSP